MSRIITVLAISFLLLANVGAALTLYTKTPSDENASWMVEREKEGLICVVVENRGRMAMSCVPSQWAAESAEENQQ